VDRGLVLLQAERLAERAAELLVELAEVGVERGLREAVAAILGLVRVVMERRMRQRNRERRERRERLEQREQTGQRARRVTTVVREMGRLRKVPSAARPLRLECPRPNRLLLVEPG
jgi:hypothetical protein